MKRYILHQTYPRCSEIKAGNYQTCEMLNEDDEVIENECGVQICLDGSYNKKCIILYSNEDGSKATMCTCLERKQPSLLNVTYEWSQWKTLSDSRSGRYREMNEKLVTDPLVLAMEYW